MNPLMIISDEGALTMTSREIAELTGNDAWAGVPPAIRGKEHGRTERGCSMSRDLSEFVTLTGTTLTTDSKCVAKHFGKRHDNVLRAFDALDCSSDFDHLNFEAVEELDEKGEMRRIVRMTKDGFMFLVMGFRGKKAAEVKECYIQAFNSMANQLQQIGMSLWDQRLELEKRDATSFMWASFGSKLMLNRKREIPEIKDERERLENDMCLDLFPPLLPE